MSGGARQRTAGEDTLAVLNAHTWEPSKVITGSKVCLALSHKCPGNRVRSTNSLARIAGTKSLSGATDAAMALRNQRAMNV